MNACRPNYIRALTLNNLTDSSVHVKVTFKSEETESFDLAAKEQKDFEKEINRGSWTEVDAVTKVDVGQGESKLNHTFVADGIEIVTYNIVREGKDLRLNKVE